MNTNKRAERARIEALDVALDRELAQCGTTDEQPTDFEFGLMNARAIDKFLLTLDVRDSSTWIPVLVARLRSALQVSEPAAPVDARDALIGEINNLAYHGTMYLSERESGNVRLCFADIISKIESHRDSIARQAAAPAEGKS